MRRRNSLVLCLLLGHSCLAICLAEHMVAAEPLPDNSSLAYRYTRPHPGPKPPKISDVTLTGTVEAVQPNGLTIKAGRTTKAKNPKEWLVLSPSDSTVFTIHGTATLDYLRKGQTIELNGQIIKDEKTADKAQEEKVADKVQELTIFSRKNMSALGKKGGGNDHAADPGVGPRIQAPKPEADSAAVLLESKDSKVEAGDSDKQKTVTGGAKTRIVGRIASCDDRQITLTVGQRTIHITLADIPTINVELSDPKFVQSGSNSTIEGSGASGHLVTMMASDLVGSKIVVRGTAVEGKSARECIATSIEITLAAPLSNPKSTLAKAKTPAEK